MPSNIEPLRSSSDVIDGRTCLVARIVDQIRRQGYYLAHVDSHTGQVLTDLRWAAQLAGREVGRRTRTYTSAVSKQLPGIITVIVAPVEVRPSAGTLGRDNAQAMIEELLRLHSSVGGRRPA